MKKSAHNQFKARQRVLGWLGFAMLALIAVCLALPTLGLSLVALVAPKAFLAVGAAAHKGVCSAALGMFGTHRILRDHKSQEGGDIETIDTESGDFEKTMRGGLKSLFENQKRFKSQLQEVTTNLGNSDKEVKKALEELTLVKNKSNSTFEEVMQKMEKVQKQIALNTRSSFRNPIERALSNEEFCFALNATARHILSKDKRCPDFKMDPAFSRFIEEKCQIEQRALTGVDAGLGQATVPVETFNEIYDLLLEYGDWSTLGVQRVGARTTVYPLMTSRPQFYWIGNQSSLAEGSQITAGAFGGGEVLLIIQTLAVLMYVSRELLADSTVNLAPTVIRHMIQSVGQGADTAAFIGTGNLDTTNAGYVGIFNAALANSNLASIAALSHTSIGATTLEDWEQTVLTVSAEVLNRNPQWWMHAQLMAKAALVRDKVGRPLFQTFTEAPGKSIGSILGYPVHPTAIAPNTDGPNQQIATFGDPEGQVVGIRQDLELATSMDIGFPQNLVAYRALLRAGTKMLTQPGSTVLKPFAVLTLPPQ
jgi:HK97 family phage major capsid protein